MMKFEDAMKQRHTVRSYLDKPLSPSFVDVLQERVDMNNERLNLSIQLKVQDSRAFTPFFRIIMAKGVKNYFILAGPDSKVIAESLGYAGADLMLFAQSLGLNTWWVGGTYAKKKIKSMAPSDRVIGIITLGYGTTQGVAHKSKHPLDVSSYFGDTPDWFKAGVTAALYAPTAVNRQNFMIKGSGRRVSITVDSGSYSAVDRGIIKYHFELGAGKENFEWVEEV